MKGRVGDQIVIESMHVGGEPRKGTILEVIETASGVTSIGFAGLTATKARSSRWWVARGSCRPISIPLDGGGPSRPDTERASAEGPLECRPVVPDARWLMRASSTRTAYGGSRASSCWGCHDGECGGSP